MISIVNTECHVPKTFSDLAKIAAWGRLGLHSANDKAGGSCHRLGRTHPDLCNVADRRRVVVVAAATNDPSLSYFEHFGI